MELIVGLGNPGEKYARTRHNIGFMALDKLVEQISNDQLPISNELTKTIQKSSNSNFQNSKKLQAEVFKIGDVILAKPQTFMNSSGVAVKKLFTVYRLLSTDLYVVHDDLDIHLGEYKIEFAHGPKLHNGIASIEDKLGTKDFWRVRIGVDNRAPENRIPGEKYVLQNFLRDEVDKVEQVVEKVVLELIQKIIM